MPEAMSKSAMIRKIDDICSLTRKSPIKAVRIVRCEEPGDSIGYCADNIDKMIQILAGLSLSHSIIKLGCMEYALDGRRVSIVRFFLGPDIDYTTNIDSEVMEHIVKLEWV